MYNIFFPYIVFIKYFYIIYKMTIDTHKIITGNPISKNLMKPWGSNTKPNSLRGKMFNRYRAWKQFKTTT